MDCLTAAEAASYTASGIWSLNSKVKFLRIKMVPTWTTNDGTFACYAIKHQ
jgi:hypothetical protein